jgi:hypothetical protein
MKKRLVWAILAAFVFTSVPSPTWADDDEAEDADVPGFARARSTRPSTAACATSTSA